MAEQAAPQPVPDTTQAPYQPPAASAEPQAPPRGPVLTQTRPQSPDDIERITIPDFQRLHAAGDAVLVDVRSRMAFVQAHIPGSISIPATELANSLHLLPRDKKIVTYCT
jgi:3-mercaptopyruvate sulfurtransferase SseA